jgi:hypothetical protein
MFSLNLEDYSYTIEIDAINKQTQRQRQEALV